MLRGEAVLLRVEAETGEADWGCSAAAVLGGGKGLHHREAALAEADIRFVMVCAAERSSCLHEVKN
jgi:hypothetical protein